jgi:ABC-type phosphate transport system substrate-binding protein
MRKRSLLLVAGACLATLSLTTGAAFADPNPGIPPDRPLAGVGSDTTQDIMNAFANGTNASVPPFGGIKDGGGNFVVSSFDATGSATITTHPTAACTNIPRPAGSGNGVTALDADTSGCIQFARSSSDLSSTHPNDTFIPFATDALTFATAAITNVPKTFTKAQLTTIYSRNVEQGCIRQPLLPHVGSGTRSSWLAFVMVGGAGQPAIGTCVKDVINGVPIEEHDGRVVTNPEQMVPFSVAQFIAQTTQPSVTDRHGPVVPRAVNGVSPFDDTFPFIRTVFNVVRNADVNSPAVTSTFGGSGAICSHSEVTKAFGFKPASNCGSTSIVN